MIDVSSVQNNNLKYKKEQFYNFTNVEKEMLLKIKNNSESEYLTCLEQIEEKKYEIRACCSSNSDYTLWHMKKVSNEIILKFYQKLFN